MQTDQEHEVKTVEFRCPHCNHPVQVNEGLLGQQVHCPNPDCERPFVARAPDGIPVTSPQERHADAPVISDLVHHDEQTLLVVHPSMWRRHPLQFLGLLLLIGLGLFMMFAGFLFDTTFLGLAAGITALVGLGMVVVAGLVLLGWWVKVRYTELRVTNKRSIYRQGIVSRETSEVQHDDVRNLQLDQNMFERIMGVGDIGISSSGQDELEIVIHDIPHPQDVVALIRDLQ